MKRPGPLQEIRFPFTPSNLARINSFKLRPRKRRLSDSSTILTPAKRRAIHKQATPSPRRNPRATSQGIPGKKLGFMSRSSNSATASITTTVSSPSIIAPFSHSDHVTTTGNPQLSSSTKSFRSPRPQLHPRSHPSKPSHLSVAENSHCVPQTSRPDPIPIMIPREMPPSPDPKSVHYPGFRVYRDTHTVLDIARPPVSEIMLDSEFDDEDKENIQPSSSPSPSPGSKGTATLEMVKSTPLASQQKFTAGSLRWEDTMRTPQRADVDIVMSTPIVTPKDRTERRRWLQDEVDGTECDEEMML